MGLGNNIERIRKQNKLKTGELAALSGVKSQHISQIENGRRTPSLKVLQKIAASLNTTTSDLLGEVPESYPVNIKKLVEAAENLNPQQLEIVINVVKEMNAKYSVE